MPNVFATNKTSSSITVAGHKVYYIDGNDAEIVEVEGTSGQALPSVGDTVTFGSYPQATSTPEPIEWTVLAVDSANGKALLIAKKALDCQNFNSGNTNTTWETCSLRTWLNDTFLGTAFNSTERGRILTTHIETPNNPSYPAISGGNATEDKVFLLSIQEASDTSYFENAAARKTLATQTAISNGIYKENGYAYWMLRSLGSDQKSVADVLPDGGLSYSGLSTYSAPGNGIRPALWLELPPAIRRNAFKYSLSGTPYWYVIDGEHDTWTDDLSAWGYSEVPVGPVLPTVTFHNGVIGTISAQGKQTVPNGSFVYLYEYSNGAYHLTEVDAGVVLAVQRVTDSSAQNATYYGFTAERTQEGYIKITNNTGATYTNMYGALVYVCSSNQATVVPVYNSSNVAYNAFKFTASGTDYYYVLDGTQTDWTDDLSSIGYSLTPAILMAYLTSTTPHSDKYLNEYNTYSIVDSNNNAIPYDSTKTYTKLGTYRVDGTSVSSNTSLVESNGYLKLYNSTPRVEVGYVEYTVS